MSHIRFAVSHREQLRRGELTSLCYILGQSRRKTQYIPCDRLSNSLILARRSLQSDVDRREKTAKPGRSERRRVQPMTVMRRIQRILNPVSSPGVWRVFDRLASRIVYPGLFTPDCLPRIVYIDSFVCNNAGRLQTE